MLEYYLLYNNENEIAYIYKPEGGEHFGTVVLNKNTDTATAKIAENDSLKDYAYMLLRRMREFVKTGKYKEKGIVAWL